MFVKLRQAEGIVSEIVDAPHGLDRELDHALKGQLEGNGETGPQVSLAIATNDRIDREEDGVDARLLGTLHHYLVQFTILMEIELIDLRSVILLAQFFHADRAKGRNTEHGSIFGGRCRNGPLPIMMEQALQSGRRAIDRHVDFSTEHLHRHIDFIHATQHIRHEITTIETCGVGAIGDLVIRRPVDIVENRARQPALGQLAGNPENCGNPSDAYVQLFVVFKRCPSSAIGP